MHTSLPIVLSSWMYVPVRILHFDRLITVDLVVARVSQ